LFASLSTKVLRKLNREHDVAEKRARKEADCVMMRQGEGMIKQRDKT
jgi:hypothetical protein